MIGQVAVLSSLCHDYFMAQSNASWVVFALDGVDDVLEHLFVHKHVLVFKGFDDFDVDALASELGVVGSVVFEKNHALIVDFDRAFNAVKGEAWFVAILLENDLSDDHIKLDDKVLSWLNDILSFKNLIFIFT